MARPAPRRSVIHPAIAVTDPLSSMSLPNSAPSRNSGKNCARNCAALPMNVCVQCASSGWPAKAAASSAATGASSSTLQPRKASQTSNARPSRPPRRPIASDALKQAIDVERGTPPEILTVHRQEGIRRAPPLVAQHAEKRPFGVDLGRGAEISHHLAPEHVDAHARPLRALGIASIRDLPEQGDHPQFLQQYGVE